MKNKSMFLYFCLRLILGIPLLLVILDNSQTTAANLNNVEHCISIEYTDTELLAYSQNDRYSNTKVTILCNIECQTKDGGVQCISLEREFVVLRGETYSINLISLFPDVQKIKDLEIIRLSEWHIARSFEYLFGTLVLCFIPELLCLLSDLWKKKKPAD